MGFKMPNRYRFQVINGKIEIAWIWRKGKFSRVLGFNMAKRLFDAATQGECEMLEWSDGIDTFILVTEKG